MQQSSRLYPDYFTGILAGSGYETSTAHLAVLVRETGRMLIGWLERVHPLLWHRVGTELDEPAAGAVERFSPVEQSWCDRIVAGVLWQQPGLDGALHDRLIEIRRHLMADRILPTVLARAPRRPVPVQPSPASLDLAADLGVLLHLDAGAVPTDRDAVGGHPRRAAERWSVLGSIRLCDRLARALDPGDVWRACEAPWEPWFRRDPPAMLTALWTDSATGDPVHRIGAYELASRWWGAALTEVPRGQDLLISAVSLLIEAGTDPGRLRLYELRGLPSAG